jgi:hypothetical protein
MKRFSFILLMSLVLLAVLASPAMANSNVTGVRTINTSILEAGDSFRVTVEMTIVGDNSLTGFGIAESLPSGWAVTAVDNGGMDKSSQESQWVSSAEKSPGESFTVIYDVTVPSGTTAATYSVSGTVEARELVNGSKVDRESVTTGDTDVEVTAGDLHIYPGDNYVDIIQNASEGSTIYWHEGTYTVLGGSSDDSVRLPNNIHIIGDGADVVDIQAMNLYSTANVGTLSTITGNDSIIEGLTLSDNAKINLDAENVTIKDCVFDAVSTVKVHGDSVIENCIFDNTYFAPRDGGQGGIIKNNIFTNIDTSTCIRIIDVRDVSFSDNVFQNLVASMDVIYVGGSAGNGGSAIFENNTFEDCSGSYDTIFTDTNSAITMKGNTFESCSGGDAVLEFADDANAVLYLNNFLNCSSYTYDYSSSSPATVSWESPTAIDYTYQGSSYSSVLGNYYSDYTGEDSNGDGIGDTAVTHNLGTDSYPLMNAWTGGEVTSELEILYDDAVYLMETDVSVEAINSGSSYDVSERSDLGALLASGLNYSISDKWYADYGSFYLVGIEGIEEKTWPGAGWGIYINGVAADYGLGLNDVEDGDVVSFYYAPYNSSSNEQFLDDATYVVHITVSDETPVEVVRSITTQTFNTGGDHLNATTVTVTLTATRDIDSLNLIETIPSGWDFTISEKDGAEFRVEPDLDDSYEWVWAGSLSAGESCTVEYLLEFPASTVLGTYELSGVASAYVDDVDVNDINVLGDSTIILEDDWNPWDDIGSDSDAAVTTAELKSAISLWCNSIPSPDTGAIITTDRLQYIIHLWLES